MLKQFLQFKLSQKLSPQQIQLMKLIQLPTQAFEQRIKQELEENPALDDSKDDYTEDEFDTNEYDDSYDNESINADDINIDEYLSDDDTPSYRLQANNYSADDEDKSVPYASGMTFTQHLINQLNTFSLNEQEYLIAEFLVGSIGDSGYIRRELIDIVDDLAFTQAIYTTEEDVEKVLKIVHKLEPTGVGARNLQECLLLQLQQKQKTKAVELATTIIKEAFDQFAKKHYKKLLQKFNITEEDLKEAISEIEKLNPKPGKKFSETNIQYIIPDITVREEENPMKRQSVF